MTEKATFGAGCFWGVEYFFRQVPGVVDAVCGYAGGKTEKPTYEDVCSHATGHAEVVEVTFEPAKTSYETLLKTFFENHDPTQLDRQGPDVGDQYRSVIFYHDERQRKAAEAAKGALKLKRPVVTAIQKAPKFWPAEDYHQRYFERRGLKPACHGPAA